MAILEVRTLELRTKPEWLGIRNRAQVTGLEVDDFWLLVFNGSDAEVGVSPEDFLPMKIIKVDCSILAGDLGEDDIAAWVGVEEVC